MEELNSTDRARMESCPNVTRKIRNALLNALYPIAQVISYLATYYFGKDFDRCSNFEYLL